MESLYKKACYKPMSQVLKFQYLVCFQRFTEKNCWHSIGGCVHGLYLGFLR